MSSYSSKNTFEEAKDDLASHGMGSRDVLGIEGVDRLSDRVYDVPYRETRLLWILPKVERNIESGPNNRPEKTYFEKKNMISFGLGLMIIVMELRIVPS